MRRKKQRPRKASREFAQRAQTPEPLGNEASTTLHYAFFTIVASGMFIRLLVFAYLGYFNNDNHLAVIDYVSRHWLPPHAGQLNQAYHPPLYYFIAAPFLRLGNLPAVQGLSLLLSMTTLTMIAVLLRQLPWIKEQARVWCLALAAFHPQFVMFSLFISNDTLAILLGALIFYQCWRAQAVPSLSRFILLGIFLGLGLLTKAVFLVFVLPLLIFVWLTCRLALTSKERFARLAAFFCLAAVLGCYKYLENSLLFGSPFTSNLDFGSWTAGQKPTWTGAASLLDFNLLKLMYDPAISASTVHSYPLMIYGSFWYALVPESTFYSNLVAPFHRLGSAIYLAALGPTILMAIGASRMAVAGMRTLPPNQILQNLSDRFIFEFTALLILVSNLFLIIVVGWSSDVWSVFQGRLLFPSYFAVLLTLHAGLEWIESSRFTAKLAGCFLAALLLLFLAYFIVEFWLSSVHPRNPLSMDHMPYKIEMNKR